MSNDDLQPKRTIYSVSELNQTIRGLLESEFPLLWVEGEISNLAQPASGHIYFTLKDAKAQVRCAMFKGKNQFLRFRPQNGQQILLRARVGLYEARGEYQLIAEHMEEAGDGALLRAFEELKARLATEGLFDEELKYPVPEIPRRIGVITSPTGAAIRDVLSVLQRRFPAIPVLIYPVAVQGEQAVPEIIRALQLASERLDCDVLLLVRGGGSLEDLWAFNEEQVARAIVDCEIPVVSGVGHEVDITIADYVADHRAATPSAAAEFVSPEQNTYLQSFIWYERRLLQLITDKINRTSERVHWLQKRLQQQHPLSYLEQQSQRLDDLQQRLITNWQYTLKGHKDQLQFLITRLWANSPETDITDYRQQIIAQLNQIRQSTEKLLRQKQQQLASLSRTLHAVSPLETLARGYAIATDQSGNTLTDSNQIAVDERFQLKLHKGQITARAEKITKDD
ncbi:MAG: exodeoxyribonuclease VII large subunit [Gammaproteobacteria bacterium]|nr:exodeoxyribonuclease VII large subunit [Gammaproteobacteria bacterium]